MNEWLSERASEWVGERLHRTTSRKTFWEKHDQKTREWETKIRKIAVGRAEGADYANPLLVALRRRFVKAKKKAIFFSRVRFRHTSALSCQTKRLACCQLVCDKLLKRPECIWESDARSLMRKRISNNYCKLCSTLHSGARGCRNNRKQW